MDIERRALYNSLRISWKQDSSLAVEPWQVEDYRALTLDQIFNRLALQEIQFDRHNFVHFAEEFDSPEDLTDQLLADADVDGATMDQIYLLIFELWRRLVPEKPSLSIFCDELDHQIDLYDSDPIAHQESIQDALANLSIVLEENTDEGVDPKVAFETISLACANDLESFLYDFTAEQIDNGDDAYASELIDDFSIFVKDVKWFDFLRCRQLAEQDPISTNMLLHQLIEDSAEGKDLEFNFEVLSFLVTHGERNDFTTLIKQTLPLLETEEDFQDLLAISADFYHRLDLEQVEQTLQTILKSRPKDNLEVLFKQSDPDKTAFLKAVST